MKKDNQTIKCSVEDCRHYEKKCCTLDKIQVANCHSNGEDDVNKGSKEATMCDSYDTK